jgi:hypothetical protein
MDGLAQIGTVLATPEMYFGFLIGFLVAAAGVWFIVKQPPQTGKRPGQKHWSDNAMGVFFILFGMLIAFAGWLKRKLVRSNPAIASAAGFFDIASMVR